MLWELPCVKDSSLALKLWTVFSSISRGGAILNGALESAFGGTQARRRDDDTNQPASDSRVDIKVGKYVECSLLKTSMARELFRHGAGVAAYYIVESRSWSR